MVWGRLRRFAFIAAAFTIACSPLAPPPEDTTSPSAAGLVRLPCRSEANLRAANTAFCARGRNWVTPRAQAVLRDAARRVAEAHPGSVMMYMEASWPGGERPMPPHLSHGDGRQIDVALFYQALDGRPLPRPPTPSGYYGYEPRRAGEPNPCPGVDRDGGRPETAHRSWRLDEARTRTLIRTLLADPRVRRLLLEPHLKVRLGFANENRIRFPGCNTHRHDAHVHVDVR